MERQPSANQSATSKGSNTSNSVKSNASTASLDSDGIVKKQPEFTQQRSYTRMASSKTLDNLERLKQHQGSFGRDGRRKQRMSYGPTQTEKKRLGIDRQKSQRGSIYSTHPKELQKVAEQRRQIQDEQKTEENRKARRFLQHSKKDLFQGIQEDDDQKHEDPPLGQTPRKKSSSAESQSQEDSTKDSQNKSTVNQSNNSNDPNATAFSFSNGSRSKPMPTMAVPAKTRAAQSPLPKRSRKRPVLNPCVSFTTSSISTTRNGKKRKSWLPSWNGIKERFPRGRNGSNDQTDKTDKPRHKSKHPTGVQSDEFPLNTKFPNSTADAAVEKPKLMTYQVNEEKYTLYPWLKPLKTLGQGAYATVCSVEDTRTKKQYAIKKNRDVFNNVADAKRILREIKLMLHMNHPNVMALTGCIPPPDYDKDRYTEIYLVMDKCDTTLKRVIQSKQRLSEDHIIYFSYQIARGLQYMHSGNIIHRDLKPENLLINTSNCAIKITDFGLSRGVNVEMDSDIDTAHKLTEYVVTRWYRAPEVMCCKKWYGARIDVWSLGCIVAELYKRKPLWKGRNSRDQLTLIFNIMGTPTDRSWITTSSQREWVKALRDIPPKDLEYVMPGSSNMAQDFVRSMLVMNPNRRPNITEVINHPFLASRKKDKHYKSCPPFNISFEFEKKIRTTFGVRHMMYEELVHFHKRLVQKERDLLTPRMSVYRPFGFGLGEYELLVTGFINQCVDGYRLDSIPYGVAKAICLYSTMCFKFEETSTRDGHSGHRKRFKVSGPRVDENGFKISRPMDVAIERMDDHGWATIYGVEEIEPKGTYQWNVIVKGLDKKSTPSIRYCDVGVVSSKYIGTAMKRVQDVVPRGGAFGKQVLITSSETILVVKLEFETGKEKPGRLVIGRFERPSSGNDARKPDWTYGCDVPKNETFRFAISMEKSGLVLEVEQYLHELM